jgi:hypothetical protein
MIQSHAPTGTRKAGGCGCGCGGSKSPCSCRKPDCQECQTPLLVRPRFFAGQLLTEDDLEALTNYVVSKQRLHTRHLHGDGVVCGLEVVCDPCERDTVTVQPGYALDCCGNDIVVPCATDLDIVAMIRQLELDSSGGKDCGDPCPDPRKPAKAAEPERPQAGIMQLKPGAEVATRRTARYCLYVRYCEQGSEPVRPYVLDEPCGDSSACEHTRVREGYRFELRCVDDVPARETILDRLKQCGDPDELNNEITKTEIRSERLMVLDQAVLSAKQPEPATFNAADANLLAERHAALAEMVAPLEAGDEEAAKQVDEEKLRKVVDTFASVARLTSKAQLVAARKGELPPGTPELAQASREVLSSAAPLLLERVKVANSTEDILLGKAAIDEGLRWTAPDLTMEERTSMASSLHMGGALYTKELATRDLQQLSQLRDWLLRRIGKGMVTDCYLRADVEKIRIDASVSADPKALTELEKRLKVALKRYVQACFCMALLPPCPPCDDTAVLLACLTVEKCEVVDICNLERTFVLSWPAMRYWVPWFGAIGDQFERLCCPSGLEKTYTSQAWDYAKVEGPASAPMIAMNMRSGTMSRTAELSRLIEHRSSIERALRFVSPSATTAGTVTRITQLLESAVTPTPADVPRTLETVVVPQGDALADALRAAAPRRVLSELIAERVEEIRPQSDLAAVTEAVNEKLESVSATIGDVRKEIRRRPLTTELADTKAVKTIAAGTAALRDVNTRLEEANKKLAERVEELVARVQKLEKGK